MIHLTLLLAVGVPFKEVTFQIYAMPNKNRETDNLICLITVCIFFKSEHLVE